ncbi:SDR family NAD(P)-dependent oxidoreductase [[Clostridium] polysaccharolyticum]|uniref:NAD(P)-dependent dehydrogenase, short-chain alcohol dehydrogenase family n=1 Tax=[Clostridium] polysaccharolyticum TaxID=29364 RepID=A0A1I0DYP4_9FIRM|nr:SDR family oxidoreductase [[Clostridium] polysaccharolyticum]SET37687.1 NAD(P)-dependent dehydrogenase, short-chain alcohol dehydrogenase family [[Clostridium] polysaccharolyticum]
MNINFEGKTVLISGAAGSLGSQLVHDYCSSGVGTLILLDLDEKEEELINLKKQYGSQAKVFTYCIDLTSVEQIMQVVKQIEKDELSVDILINNAGINILSKVVETSELIWDKIIDLNLKGSFFLTKAIGESSLVENKGNVIFVSSQHGVVGNQMRAAYCSSKSALVGLVHALTAEWSTYGVRVNSIAPTFILNNKNEEFLLGPREKRNYLNKIPLHRYAVPEDVSNAILFLTSDKASMITGHNLLVDGGYTSI